MSRKVPVGWNTIVADLAERTPTTRFVYVADREGDLRALMDAAAQRAHAADGLVRAQLHRKTASGDKLWSRVEKTDPLGEVELMLPAAPGRAARRVRQTLYRDTVTLPALRKAAPEVTVTAILAREEQPPPVKSPSYGGCSPIGPLKPWRQWSN